MKKRGKDSSEFLLLLLVLYTFWGLCLLWHASQNYVLYAWYSAPVFSFYWRSLGFFIFRREALYNISFPVEHTMWKIDDILVSLGKKKWNYLDFDPQNVAEKMTQVWYSKGLANLFKKENHPIWLFCVL